jgi:hypothetical protein
MWLGVFYIQCMSETVAKEDMWGVVSSIMA